MNVSRETRQRFHVVLGPRNPNVYNWHELYVWAEDNHDAGEQAQAHFGASSVYWEPIAIERVRK